MIDYKMTFVALGVTPSSASEPVLLGDLDYVSLTHVIR
jgi:hypothetical protein